MIWSFPCCVLTLLFCLNPLRNKPLIRTDNYLFPRSSVRRTTAFGLNTLDFLVPLSEEPQHSDSALSISSFLCPKNYCIRTQHSRFPLSSVRRTPAFGLSTLDFLVPLSEDPTHSDWHLGFPRSSVRRTPAFGLNTLDFLFPLSEELLHSDSTLLISSFLCPNSTAFELAQVISLFPTLLDLLFLKLDLTFHLLIPSYPCRIQNRVNFSTNNNDHTR